MARAVQAPQRRCLVTREVKGQDQMIRFVLDPGGHVVPDVDGRLPGRGMWLSAAGGLPCSAATARAAVHMPCAIARGKPKAFAVHGCRWMGFTSPLTRA